MIIRRRFRAALLVVSAATACIVVTGAAAGSARRPATTPAPVVEVTVDQTPPPSLNGITVDGSSWWIASIAANAVYEVDQATGAILGRYDLAGAAPDDVAVGPDGDVYVTAIATGEIWRIADDAAVVATLEPQINPLEFSPDGMLYVGMASEGGSLYRVPLDGSEPTVVAGGLPSINAFVVTADAVLAPAGGFDPGSVVRIDAATGAVTTVATEFPTADGNPPLLLASAADADGGYYALANITGEIFAVDVETGVATLHATVGPDGLPADNLAFGPDGSIFVTSYVAAEVTVIAPDGQQRIVAVGDPALAPPA